MASATKTLRGYGRIFYTRHLRETLPVARCNIQLSGFLNRKNPHISTARVEPGESICPLLSVITYPMLLNADESQAGEAMVSASTSVIFKGLILSRHRIHELRAPISLRRNRVNITRQRSTFKASMPWSRNICSGLLCPRDSFNVFEDSGIQVYQPAKSDTAVGRERRCFWTASPRKVSRLVISSRVPRTWPCSNDACRSDLRLLRQRGSAVNAQNKSNNQPCYK